MSAEQLLVLVWMCFLVPGATAIAPARSTRSRIMRGAIHLACIGGAFYAVEYVSDGILQRCLIGLAFIVILQYWASVLLVAAYERRYDRAPPAVMLLVSRLGLSFADRLMSLGWLVVALGGAFAVLAVSKYLR